MEKPKSHKAILLVLLAAVALNIALALFAMKLALSKVPLDSPKTDNAGLFAAAAKLQGLPAKIKGAKPGDVDTVVMSEADFNSLLAAALGKNGLQAQKAAADMPVKSISVRLRDSIIQVDFTKDIGFWTPFGSFLNAHARMKFEIDESSGAEAKLLKLRLGNLNVPPWLVQWWLDGQTDDMNDSQKSEDFRRIVVAVKTPPGLLSVKYHPYELRQLIESKLNSPLLKGFWDML